MNPQNLPARVPGAARIGLADARRPPESSRAAA